MIIFASASNITKHITTHYTIDTNIQHLHAQTTDASVFIDELYAGDTID